MNQPSQKSHSAYARAQSVLVGGVNSPVRAFQAVGGEPPFIVKGSGAQLVDLDGNEYIDYVGSYGPAILGHAPQQVTTAITKAARHGTSFGAPTEGEIRLAEVICRAVPSVEKLRFTNSGTEAVMTAVRLARGHTSRNMVVKFIGCYHGHSDALLVQAGSGATTLGTPSSPGVPPGATAETLLVAYNDLDTVRAVFAEHGPNIAAVLVEPVAGNMGVIPPVEGFLETLRTQCTQQGALLIFDEVMTGFRIGWGGAQERYGISPDLTTLGKIIGGGMPVGAVGGSADIMDHLAPTGPIYQAGTLSGNPLAMAAGLATLDAIAADEDFYETLEETSAQLVGGLLKAARKADLDGNICIQRVGSMVCVFFAPTPVDSYDAATSSNTRAFAAFFHTMLESGIYLPPSAYESWFVSAAHGPEEIRQTLDAAGEAFATAAELM